MITLNLTPKQYDTLIDSLIASIQHANEKGFDLAKERYQELLKDIDVFREVG